SNFDDRQTFRLEAQYATFSDVQHLLLKLSRPAATKGNVFNLRDEFSVLALFYDPKATILHPQVEASSCEIAAEKEASGGCGDINKTSAARCHVWAESESRHVDVTLLIDFQKGEATAIKTGPLKKGELIRRGNNGVCVRSTAKREIQQGHAANGALFDHPRHFAVQPFVEQDS